VASADVSKTPDLVTLDLTAGTPTRNDPNAKVIFPNLGYKTQIATALWTVAYATLAGDMSLQNKTRIWIDGNYTNINIPDSQKILMTDPTTGYTYVAGKYGRETIDGKSVELGIGSRMLEHANALIAGAYIVQRDGSGKPILDVHGRPYLILDGNGFPQAAGNVSTAAVNRYIQVVDAMKEFTQTWTLADIGH
jgi:hypothetical protein